jgi:surfactin synthase thioesterase subunit
MNHSASPVKIAASSCIRLLSSQTFPGGIILLCFPFAGGGANVFRSWSQCAGANIEVYGVALPGREARISETNIGCADTLCNAIVAELVNRFLHRPIVFFGHSMGSMLAYEVAVRLQTRYNWIPQALFASGRQAPHKKMGGNFHTAPEEVFIRELKRLNGTPDSIFEDPEMKNIVVSILRADYQLIETYKNENPTRLNAPIVTCCGDNDPEVHPDEMTHWSELTSHPCTHHLFEGGHFFLQPKAREIIALIRHQTGINSTTGNKGYL